MQGGGTTLPPFSQHDPEFRIVIARGRHAAFRAE